MRNLIIFLFVAMMSNFNAQEFIEVSNDTTIKSFQEFDEIVLPRNFKGEYRKALHRVRKVYPLALHAAYVIDSLENDLSLTTKKRVQNKASKELHKSLKADFKFVVKDMYTSEGIVLSKLIYRETGMTVEEIISKYRGESQAGFYNIMASLFDQDLNSTYNPDGEDFILECVIRDIESGKIDFDNSFNKVSKEAYKEHQKNIKLRKKKARKQKRADKKKKHKDIEVTT